MDGTNEWSSAYREKEYLVELITAINQYNPVKVSQILERAKGDPTVRFKNVINRKSDKGLPLVTAISLDLPRVCEILLSYEELDPNVVGYENDFALNRACHMGRYQIVKMLLDDARTHVNKLSSPLERNMLQVAIRTATFAAVDIIDMLLLDGRIDPNEGKVTPLHIAIEEGFYLGFERLIKDPRTDVNALSLTKRTPLIASIECSNERYNAFVDVLLKHKKINVNYKNERTDCALIVACMQNRNTSIRKLLKRNDTNVNAKSSNMAQSAVHLLYKNGSLPTFKLLLKRTDLNINAIDIRNETALFYFDTHNNTCKIKELLNDERVNLEHENDTGHTALVEWVILGFPSRARALMKNSLWTGACIKLQNSRRAGTAIVKEIKAKALAVTLLSSHHVRLGARSPIKCLPVDLFRELCIRYLDVPVRFSKKVKKT